MGRSGIMAYRRRQGNPRPATYEEYVRSPRDADENPSSIAAQAIRASSSLKDASLSSVYAESAFSSFTSSTEYKDPGREEHPSPPRNAKPYEYTSIKSLNEPTRGFWGVLARKAKSFIEDDNATQQGEDSKAHKFDKRADSLTNNLNQSYQPPEGQRKKHLDSLASSINYIGGKVSNALEEGISIVEDRTADIIEETRKLNIRRKGNGFDIQSHGMNLSGQREASQIQGQHDISQIRSDQQTQLKASRDVANAMAAKAKLLMRELKTIKADLAFAKERCSQLEEENKILRESRNKEDHPEDDDLIRLQLETLLAEKARLAHENSVYARENRFLREIVEYHQLTMQDVVYLDEGSEEVTEVNPIQLQTLSSPSKSRSPSPSVPPPPSSSTPVVPLTRQSSSSSPPPTPTSQPPQTSNTPDASSPATTMQAIPGVADPDDRKSDDGTYLRLAI